MKLDSAILYTNNLERAVGFYKQLGLEIEYQDGDKFISFILKTKRGLE